MLAWTWSRWYIFFETNGHGGICAFGFLITTRQTCIWCNDVVRPVPLHRFCIMLRNECIRMPMGCIYMLYPPLFAHDQFVLWLYYGLVCGPIKTMHLPTTKRGLILQESVGRTGCFPHLLRLSSLAKSCFYRSIQLPFFFLNCHAISANHLGYNAKKTCIGTGLTNWNDN